MSKYTQRTMQAMIIEKEVHTPKCMNNPVKLMSLQEKAVDTRG